MLAACKESDHPQPPAPVSAPVSAPVTDREPPPPPAAPRAPPYRIARQRGEAQALSGPLGVHWATPAASELAIDLPNGARLAFEPNSRAVLLAAAPATVVLLEGKLHAQLFPRGSVPDRAPLRIVSADAVYAIPIAGELWVAGRYAAVLAGSVERERWSEREDAPEVLPLGAGQLLRDARAAPITGPRTLEQARAAHAKERSRALEPPPRSDAGAESALVRALDAWDVAEHRGNELLSVQRAAKTRGDSAAAQALQRDLVTLAQSKLALRKRVRLAFELAAARRLADGDVGELGPFASRTEARAAAVMPSGL